MRRTISKENPFSSTPRFAFGFELLPDQASVLDYGCHDGRFGYLLKQCRNIDYMGVDKNKDAIKKAPAGIIIHELVQPLPFIDKQFDAVTMFEVIEHINDQNSALREVYRVLKPGGLLLVSVPRKHVFSFLDLANFKFIFPNLHRWYYSITRSSRAYMERYVANPNGLIGDIEREKLWHQHFSDNEMRKLLETNGFLILEMDGAGLFSQLFTFLGYVLRLGVLFPQRVRDWDNRTFHSSSLLCAARKPS